ncbi:ABC transporter substrate-binding protein [Persicirhabdus sediminis]|uniref:ABC transporter substrate-binding protein n=1 Tax=Persicirhabdus sediminis TaxID=454144 RepID=A0A8J7SLD3_9BACT|nr:ABC transporter substrate-binding protein [Persicirhabdus sediminis]MBK1792296.1 ABC transporter substrate-binding protein [Persicirhabdus sediminis]
MYRRHFLSLLGLSAALSPNILRASNSTKSKMKLKIAGYDFDRVAALAEGKVSIDGCDYSFERGRIGEMNTDVFSGKASREVTEIGLHPFMLAYANEGFRDYTLLPIFPVRTFRHKSIFIRTDAGIKKPEDLKGRRIATPGFSSTSLTWIRGILQHQYGISPQDVEWVVSSKDSSAGATGTVSKQELMIPDGLKVASGPEGKDESQMLVDGDVDALFHAVEPQAYIDGNPLVSRLFPDFRATEQAYFKETGIFPIMHAVAIKKSLINAQPWLAQAIFDAYCESKTLCLNHLKENAWIFNSLPWANQEVENTIDLMGENWWPYGIEPNKKTLNALFQYSHEQGLAKHKLEIDQLFHPASLSLSEKV